MQKRKIFAIFAVIATIPLIVLSAQCKAPDEVTGEAPTIELQIYDGPEYLEADGMCHYRVEAVITGLPDPEVRFADADNINQLGPGRAEVGVEVGDTYTLKATATNPAGTANASITLNGECSEYVTYEETTDLDAEADSDSDTDSVADADADRDSDSDAGEEATSPTIDLEIYQGPFPVEDLCVYRVQANITGNPTPTVTFSKDDSGGAWGSRKAQVNLGDPSDTYTLTATATNSAGSATDSITLTWGCEVPEGTESEPEPESEPEVNEISIAVKQEGVSGEIWDYRYIRFSGNIYIGDSDSGNYSKGYLSFDIRGLHGKTVQDAEINFTSITGEGEPNSFASEIVVKVFNYMWLDYSDFAVGGVYLSSIPISAAFYTISGNTLKNELQAVLDDESRDYFQLKLGLNSVTNGDGVFDGIYIGLSETILNISYSD